MATFPNQRRTSGPSDLKTMARRGWRSTRLITKSTRASFTRKSTTMAPAAAAHVNGSSGPAWGRTRNTATVAPMASRN